MQRCHPMNAYPTLYARLCAHCVEEGGCWTWVGPTRRHGGGCRPALSMRTVGLKHPVSGLAMHPQQRNAARLMCELFYGPPPTPLHEAGHVCEDNWLCVHPWHLTWETKKENMARMWKRRREEMCFDIGIRVAFDAPIPF